MESEAREAIDNGAGTFSRGHFVGNTGPKRGTPFMFRRLRDRGRCYDNR